jgi:hypothetical protein
MQFITKHKTKFIVAVLILNLIVTTYFVITLRQLGAAVGQVAQVIGQSGILTQGADGKIIINRVVTVADVQAAQNQPPM